MSLRGTKRATSRGEESGSKRRKAEPDDLQWQPRPINDLKINSIYNRSAPEAPAELFRKDLISAMKLPDSEPLSPDEYWVITDPWKQEWERGVQVPVNPDSLPEPTVTEIQHYSSFARNEFKLPKKKYVRLSRDANFNPMEHYLSSAVAHAEAACAYDMDACDAAWLRALNGERARAGAQQMREEQLERVIEELEVRCYDKIQATMKSEEGLGIEYDENVICDVCRSPDSEEGNEMVFCDDCNICVHQACYGITTIPSGQWLCRPCGDGVRPVCVLCPNLGGAMKCTPSGHKWAHVSCVLWIPEVSIGCAERMEPITKISAIPPSRWNLICILCRERTGACIQCSVKTCKTAYHVTCAFKHGLEMRAIIEDENADDGVKLRSYCQKHSVNCKKDKSAGSGSDEDDPKRKRRKDMTSEEKSHARAVRLQEVESEFDRHVSIKDISSHLMDVDQDGIQYIYNYWKLKRRAGHDRPLLPPKADESDMLSHRQEQADLDKMKMFVQLRQDLERVRNLCYMVSRREKLSRSFIRMREQTFHKQTSVLSVDTPLLPPALLAVIEANHGPSIYDRLYSHPGVVHVGNFENLLTQIAGLDSGDEKKKDLNGLVKSTKSPENPYKRLYLNGSGRRSTSLYSGLSSGAESMPDRDLPLSGTKYHRQIYSTTDDDEKPVSQPPKKKIFSKDRENQETTKVSDKKKSRIVNPSRTKKDSSSEEDIKPNKEWDRSHTLRKMEREMGLGLSGLSESESDELMLISTGRKSKLPPDIYSDSESSDNHKNEDANEDKSSNATSDSQQQLFRTKAAVKEFNPSHKGVGKCTRQAKKALSKTKGIESEDDSKETENLKSIKNKDYPSDLIVPQRQAAKKASENMRSNTTATVKKEQTDIPVVVETKPTVPPEDVKAKPKQKVKEKRKDIKDSSSKEASKKDRKSSLNVNDVFEFEKESDKDGQDILAYVPQRQAAKKAAEHIKSGMAKIPGAETTVEEPGKKKELPETSKKLSPKKDEEKTKKSPNKSSSSSAVGSSSSSCSSSSSSEEEGEKGVKVRGSVFKSIFSPPRSTSDDLPFLDKGAKVPSSSSPSSDSETHKKSSQVPSSSTSPRRSRQKKSGSPAPVEAGTPRKAADKKPKPVQAPERELPSPPAEREKPSRAVPRASARTRTRSAAAGARSLLDGKDAGPGKPLKEQEVTSVAHKTPKENCESSELPFAQWKTDKKLDQAPEESQSIKQLTTVEETEFGSHDKADNVLVHHSDEKDTIRTPKCISSPIRPLRDKENIPSPLIIPIKVVDPIDVPDKSPEESILKHSISVDHSKYGNVELDRYSVTDVDNFKKIEKDSVPQNERNIFRSSSRILSGTHIIKSPKTPIDIEHKMPEPCEGQTPKSHEEPRDIDNSVKLESAEAVTTFDIRPPELNEIQETEHNKPSNKASLHISSYPNRSIFSPQADSKDNPNLDILNDFLSSDEMPNQLYHAFGTLFKEDSKEDRGVGATYSLVEKLRMGMNSKISGDCNQNEKSEPDISEVKVIDKFAPPFVDTKPKSVLVKNDDKKDDIYPTCCKENPIEEDLVEIRKVRDQTHPFLDMVFASEYDEEKAKRTKYSPMKELDNDEQLTKSDDTKCSTENQYNSSDNCNMEIDKQMSFDMDSKEIPTTLQNDLMGHSHALSTNESFLHRHAIDKDFERLDLKTNASSTMESIVTVDHQSESHIGSIQETTQSQSYEGDVSMQPPECTPISSPFNSMIQQSKWSESELIPARRSSTSSSSSNSSTSSHKPAFNKHSKPTEAMQVQFGGMGDNLQAMDERKYAYMSYPSMEGYIPYSSEASPFISGPVSLFPPTTIASQIPLTSPAASFPSNLNVSFQTPISLLSQLPKSSEESMIFTTSCSAAFTSSSHNMALTTAMVAPSTPKPVSEHSPAHEGESELTPPNSFSMQESPLPANEDFTSSTIIQNQLITEKHLSQNDISPLHGKKSPTKPTRMSSRFISQQVKSPGKIHGKSPKQMETAKGTVNRRGVARNSRGSRTRGRPRVKNNQNFHNVIHEYQGNTIHHKLLGTVYDFNFDEEIDNDVGDLKSMRERRRSTDIHERKPDNAYRDSSQSPRDHKFTSPSHQQAAKRTSYSADIRDLRPPTPISELPDPVEPPKSPSVISVSAKSSPQSFTNIVHPVLPGPVDMRTYSAFEPSVTVDFNNHLLRAFASGIADQQLPEIDEEMEKAFHSALIASTVKSQEPFALPSRLSSEVQEPPCDETIQLSQEICTPKVSLTDSRNQLKVKIKGPFLDANYCTSSVAPVIQQPSQPMEQPTGASLGTPSAVGSASSAMMSGTSNLRRMRKKELLRQYCTQDMNMDDPVSGSVINQVAPPASDSLFNRTMITIPKAVASMTSIPTREDYKAVVDANMEKKRRKVSGGMNRDFHSMDMDDDLQESRNMSGLSYPTQLALSYKRRGRTTKPSPTISDLLNTPTGPKLKIKIGNYVEQVEVNDPNYVIQFKPPKKRLTNIPAKPSVEDLRRESMKYRRMIMADFEEGKKEKKKRVRSEKRKKKREKRSTEMHVVNKQSESATKLIIRIARKKEDPGGSNDLEESAEPGTEPRPAASSEDPYSYDPTAQDPLALDSPRGLSKVSPIRLKLARGGGSGYVMKDSPAPEDAAPLLDPSNPGCPPLPHSKHCEVR